MTWRLFPSTLVLPKTWLCGWFLPVMSRDVFELLLCPCDRIPVISQGMIGLFWPLVSLGSVHCGRKGVVEQYASHHGPEDSIKRECQSSPSLIFPYLDSVWAMEWHSYVEEVPSQ